MCLLRRDEAEVRADAPLMTLLAAEVGMGIQNALLFNDLRWREEHRQRLLAKVLSAQEQERSRLARELHDDTGQALIALMFGVDGVAAALPPGDGSADGATDQLTRQVASLREMSEEALSNLRRMVMALRPTALDDLGLVAAIQRYADYVLAPAGIAVTVEASFDGRLLDPDREVAVFRIVQEALNNVARHSRATHSYVRINRDGDTLTVVVEDDGAGFPATPAADPMSGVGIEGMHERAELLGGTLEISSQPGHGTVVRLATSIAGGLEQDAY